ncbi:MAG: ferric iron uptake transcriptional regulator [Woeseiaceae bacterium]
MQDEKDLKKAGLRTTIPRLKILEIFGNSRSRHLSAEEVYRNLLEEGEDIGLATVYRVLTQFESAGLLKKNTFGDNKAVFELDSGEHHDHMICVQCGGVQEFHNDLIENMQLEVCKSAKFELSYHEMNLYGVCSDCSKD